MGSGAWNASTYVQHTAQKRAAGQDTFHYSQQAAAGNVDKVHKLLDPLDKATDASPFAGQVMREICISDEHPHPTAIAIILDVTASNGAAARAVHAKLPQLFGLLQRKGFVEDPQILISAVGDANTDNYPLQVGQFESDNRIDAMVEAMILEGGGGGQVRETYEVAAYYLANHVHNEPWIKQGRSGYAIFIGDEKPYKTVKRVFDNSEGHGYGGRGHTLESLTGDTVEADIPTSQVFEDLREKAGLEPFFLFQKQGSYSEDGILPEWRDLLGENALVLDDPNNVCEFIAGLLAMREGGLDADDLAGELGDDFDPAAIASVSKTLAVVGSGGAVATTQSGALDIPGDSGTDRL